MGCNEDFEYSEEEKNVYVLRKPQREQHELIQGTFLPQTCVGLPCLDHVLKAATRRGTGNSLVLSLNIVDAPTATLLSSLTALMAWLARSQRVETHEKRL